ncbi:MAG: alcohol dehydrogenase catalytic domain-containing protein [Clostridiales Family XIII bacterium]|jgi:L-iditol 2-dehydrogenase|nr:alcohol dehydrogenase catalytic domain-containing protein [Clostridiales Family XIII bacterium]
MLAKTMKRAVLEKPGAVRVEEAPIPAPGPGEVLLKVRNIGICGSDIHIYEGLLPFVTFPVVQGHEMSGEVVDAGGSARLKNGDRVTIIPRTLCGRCPDCEGGRTNWCRELEIVGVHRDGVAAEYVCVPEYMATKIPDGMAYDVAAMIEPLAVCVHACNISGGLDGRNALVIGAGVIGNLTAQAAKAKGARVMIAGRTQYRLDYAKAAGIDICVNDSRESLEDAVAREFGGGADVVFECIGVDASVNGSFAHCRKGGTVVILGIFGEKQPIDMFTLQDKELRVVGSMLYLESDFDESMALAQTGSVALEPLITGRFPLEGFAEAYRAIEARRSPIMKVMIEVS